MFARHFTRHRVLRFAVPLLAALLLAGPAGAQSENSRRPQPTTQGAAPSQVPEAPIGHRQPTAAVVAGERMTEQDVERNKRDRALDRKLQFCRGC